MTSLSPGTPRPSGYTRYTGEHGADPTEGSWSRQYPWPPVSHEPRIQEISDSLERGGYHPFPAPFRYIDLGSAAYIARGNAVVSAGRLQLSGFPGWVVWLFIHIAFLTGYRNRVGALLTWWVAFTRDVRRERAYTTREVGRVRDIYQPVEEAGTPAVPPK